MCSLFGKSSCVHEHFERSTTSAHTAAAYVRVPSRFVDSIGLHCTSILKIGKTQTQLHSLCINRNHFVLIPGSYGIGYRIKNSLSTCIKC